MQVIPCMLMSSTKKSTELDGFRRKTLWVLVAKADWVQCTQLGSMGTATQVPQNVDPREGS